MSVRIRMICDGCFKETETSRIRQEFVSFSGRGYGMGVVKTPTIDDVCDPTGWVWSDPYTFCTYCPDCWAEINTAVVQS